MGLCSDLHLPSERKAVIDRFVGTWNFSAHDYSDDELLWASYLILKHTLSMPGVEKWRISDGEARTNRQSYAKSANEHR